MLVDVTKVAATIGSLSVIVGALFAVFTFIKKNEKQDADIKKVRQEQKVMTIAIRACLDGLQQLKCNGKVTEGIDLLDEHLNNMAHDD